MEHLPLVFAVIGAAVGLCAWVRFDNDRQAKLIKAELAVSLLQHVADCPARAAAHVAEDDSGDAGAVQPRHYSPSGHLVIP